jgi:hypothetical protein
MQSTRRFLAFAVLGAAGLMPAVARAQADAGADDLMKRLRGAPGSRVGGATRGIKRDQPTGTATPQPGSAAALPATTSAPARVAGAAGG